MRQPKRGTGSIYKQRTSDIWWLKYYRHGRVVRESSGTTEEAKAWKILENKVAQVRTGTHPDPATERIKVDELAEDLLRDYKINAHKSLDDVEARWRLHLAPVFAGMRAAHVTSKHLAEYVDQRQQDGATNATINREMAALKRAFNIGYKATPRKVLYVPAFPHLKENNARTGFLEDVQFDRLVEGAELWFRTLVECGATIGWRHEELLGLRVRQVDLEHRIVRLEPGTTKNGEGREAPMTDTMWQLLRASVEGKAADDPVFTRRNGKPVLDFRTTWENACARAGVPDLLFHDLRRTAARRMRNAGLSEQMIMRIGGWRTPSVFHRYAIVNRQDMANAIRQVEEHQRSLAQARSAQNGHTLGIQDDPGAENIPPTKLQ
jgi:integrase